MRPVDIIAIAAFSDEVRSSVPEILAALDRADRDRADPAATQEAFRLIHAMKGAASMVGLPALSHLLNQAEEPLDRIVSDGTALTDDLIAVLRVTAPRWIEYLDLALSGAPALDTAIDLSAAFRAFSGRPGDAEDAALHELLDVERRGLDTHRPAPAAAPPHAVELDFNLTPSEPVPAELAEVFAQEAQEQLQTIAKLTTHLAAAGDDRESLHELRRAVHTLKGAAGVVGYKAASRLAHRMEDLLDRAYDGESPLTSDEVHLLTVSHDALDDVMTGALDPEAVRATLGRLFAQYDAMGATAPVSGPAPAPEPAAIAVLPRAAAPAERRQGSDRRRSGDDRRVGAQIVRVPFQRLGDLVRLVSELVVNRSLFDEHYAALIRQVEEVKLSTQRLRRVALKLETGYEVRALAGNGVTAAGAPAGHGFDELEFDRYTEFHLLSRELAETATDIGTLNLHLAETIGNFDGDLTRLGRLTREVQDKVMEFRMVPLSTLASRLERTVRVTADACGKDAELALDGEHVALDKTMLEAMTDPLLHLLRNAVDHGIESPEARAAAGKPPRGRITVRASHEGTEVLLEVEDDGGGLDPERIRRTAIDRGHLSEADAAALGPDELFAFVFQPGFSTAARLSEVSGRGVGLDIVKAMIGRLGGRIDLASTRGSGTRFTLRVPMTLAITRILQVRVGDEIMGIPMGAILQIVRPDQGATTTVGTERVVEVSGRLYPLRDLAAALGLPAAAEPARGSRPVLIVNVSGRHVGFAVEEIVQSRDAVIKTLGTHLRRVPGIWGATLLGDGTVVLIVRAADLAGGVGQPQSTPGARRAAAARRPYRVLVVDDSLSMRHVLSNAVKRAGWEALQARDGVEALELVTGGTDLPDLILLDIEMPRMDGYEFLATMRAQPALRALPVVMLTSRGGEKHRDKAMSLGASDYVVKPFQEEALLQNVDRLIRAARGQRLTVAS